MLPRSLALPLSLLLLAAAAGQPASVEHTPAAQAFGEPASTTQREPDAPRENETVQLFARVSYQFTYDRVCIYYTTDGSDPQGSFGSPAGSTQVLRNDLGSVTFLRNENNNGTRDWWTATLPSGRAYGQTVKYKISAWKPFVGPEVFANSGAAYTFTTKLPWPGAGAGQPNPAAGYPPVSFWKEEAFIGNRYTAAMLDQNGAWWDMLFPTPGAVQGVGTKNEGYSDAGDTFPPLLSSDKRGQMHLNQAMVGLRVDGLTHWLSNPDAVSYSNVRQSYLSDDSNTVATSQTLSFNKASIDVAQLDFAPAGVAFPDALAGRGPQRHILIKRMLLTNRKPQAQTADVYLYLDPALNGGDQYDAMFWDPARGAMTAFDKTRRTVAGQGPFISDPDEYNPSTFPGYDKNIALYLTSAMKVVGAGPNPGASDAWRDSSPDQGQGWIARRVTLPPNQTVEVDFLLAGAHLRPEPITDPIPADDGVYDDQLVPVLDWFYNNNLAALQSAADAYWANWLAAGTTLDSPDPRFDRLLKRSLLATALHQDALHGAVVAGYHNGAYYFSWPRDGMWAAVTLMRTGHLPEGLLALNWMKDACYRDVEPSFGLNPASGLPTRGFWKQKYSTDGFTIWGAPQIDGTAVYPWALASYYDLTADAATLNAHYPAVWDAVQDMTRDSQDSRLRYEEAFNLVYSNSLWEDSYDTFVFSNANVVRGLRDAARIASLLNRPGHAAAFEGSANGVKSGLDARLDWNGENTDASQLGIVYPFAVYAPTDPRAVRVIDRINGVAPDRFGNFHPIVNFAGFFSDGQGWTDLINRYWADSYWGDGSASSPWGAGPWFLTTMWYGMYYAERQDFTPGSADIDNHKYRLDLLLDRLGPVGLGAEQIAARGIPGQPAPRDRGSLRFPAQNDFMLQTAWPNAWESMSFFVDSVMAFLDYSPDAAHATINVRPKPPSAWPTMTFRNITLADAPAGLVHHIDLTVDADAASALWRHTFTNRSGLPVNASTVIRTAPNLANLRVTRNGAPAAFTYDPALGTVTIPASPLETGQDAATIFEASTRCPVDFNNDGFLDFFDYDDFVACYETGLCPPGASADFNGDQFVDFFDYDAFVAAYELGC